VRERINNYLAAYEQLGYLSGTVLVAKDGEVWLNEGYGLSNREHEVKNSGNTIFRLASISKSFTAASVMLLHERGLLEVDAPIRRYLPEFPNGERMTVHHLLTHTSGLSRLAGLNMKVHTRLEDLVQRLADKPLLFQPGDRSQYGNSGYILLTYLIEQVSGRVFEEFLQNNIFQPLGMSNSGMDVPNRILKNKASGYSVFEDRVVNGKYNEVSTLAGAAGLYSTAYDLYLWDQALHSERLLRKESRRRIFTSYCENYGYGWYLDRQMTGGTARHRIFHGGLDDSGFFTRLSRFPEDRLTIVTLSNFLLSPLERINRDLAAIFYGGEIRLPEPPHQVAEESWLDYETFVGKYEASMPIPVWLEQTRLFIKIFGFKLELVPEGDTPVQTDFYATAAYVRVSFKKAGSGIVSGATIRWLGEDEYYAEKKNE
jgi:CubicO group peptidase (beta-lactamase class C family)